MYAKQAKLGTAAINSATAIKLKAERRLADAVDEGQAAGEIAVKERNLKHGPDVRSADIGETPTTFDELGVTRQRVAEARTIRDNYTDEQIDDIITEANANDVSVRGVGARAIVRGAGEGAEARWRWCRPSRRSAGGFQEACAEGGTTRPP